jgi:Na+-translocating ferredoxin:NAD+ oxidoreductase RNF subunit RnfB
MILQSALLLGGLGIASGAALAWASKKFAAPHDARVDQVLACLPGVNCGSCGYASCEAYANAIIKDDAPIDRCTAGKEPTAQKLKELLNKKGEIAKQETLVAVIHCKGGRSQRTDTSSYRGIQSCVAAETLPSAQSCSYGCLYLGDCVRACKFDAIHLSENGLPAVDKTNCVGCGACVTACPKEIIKLGTPQLQYHVLCSSHDKAKDVVKHCTVGCIACGACARACPEKAVGVSDNLSSIDHTKCKNIGKCLIACPRKTIERIPLSTDKPIPIKRWSDDQPPKHSCGDVHAC